MQTLQNLSEPLKKMNFRLVLLFVQIYIHISFFLGLYYFNVWYILLSLIICHLIFSGLCGTVFFHRVVTHKNTINPIIENILLWLSTLGASGSALGWAATHRAHHRYSDTEKDPHSPKHLGLLKTYWYSSANESSIRYVPDLLKKKKYLFQHKYYFLLLSIFHLLFISLFSYEIYWTVCIVPAFLMWFTGSIINCFGHDSNGPINNNLLGLFLVGEGWHKNHHEYASNPQFGKYDLGYLIYRMIR